MKLVQFILLFFISLSTLGQKEANIWYFGTNAGVDFNSGAPVALTDGMLTTLEGCATISDKFGNLLFYTDGRTAYNKIHAIMPNGAGLKGHSSATQSGVIVPKPGSTTIFYIFTVDCCGGVNGLHYSEVDMTLDGGKGDITASKNILLKPIASEKITAVLHSNKKDIWVITSDYRSNVFQAYLVTSGGVAPALTSTAGAIPSGAPEGHLKSSSDGKLLVHDIDMASIDLLRFDNTTGIVSTWFNFPFAGVYGSEFSPDAKKLYATKLFSANIYQFDLSSGLPPSIIASEVIVGTMTGVGGFSGGALQVGPDKKMYMTKYNSTFLACLTNPNNLGAACGFIDNAVSLSGKKGQLGLPNFIQSYFSASPFTYTNVCRENPTIFLIQDSISPTGVTWNFGDPASGASNSSSFFAPKHTFTSVGTFTVKAIVTSSCCPNDTLKQVITISEKPNIALGNDTTICIGTNLNLSVVNTYTAYLWNTSSSTYSTTTTGPGTYWVKVNNECGFTTDTIHIGMIDKPSFVLRNDTSVCDGISLNLNVTSTTYSITNYLWNNSSTSSSITVNTAGKYWAKASNQCGSVSDTVNISILYKPNIALRNDTVMCQKSNYVLSVANTYTNYLWQNGNTTNSITVNDVGTYWVRVTNICGSTTDTIKISYCDIEIPNVITVNGDGINDVFSIRGLQLGVADVKILNRWGNLIYETKGYNNDWSPKDINDGVYYYIINYPPNNKTYTGFVSVFGTK
jgi:gliding motility-associated-like protein